jgi:hypothetical protein
LKIFLNGYNFTLKKLNVIGHWWLMPVILAIQEAEIRRIVVRSQPRQIVCETLSQKSPSSKKGDGIWQMDFIYLYETELRNLLQFL